MKTAIKLNEGNSKEYKVKILCDNEIYAKKLDSSYHLLGLYYLVLWKGYFEEKNTWKPASTIQHLWKLVITFYHDHPNKLTATFPPINFAFSMAKPTIKSRTEVSKKYSRLAKANGTSKRIKKSWDASFLSRFGPISIASKRSFQSHDLYFAPLRSQFDFLIFFTSRDSPSFFGFSSEVLPKRFFLLIT